MIAVRAGVVSFSTHCCAIIRRPGEDDEFLIDEAGRPRRFTNATAALAAGRAHLRALEPASVSEPAGDLEPDEVAARRAQREVGRRAERERVFGPDDELMFVRGRVVIQRRRRRR